MRIAVLLTLLSAATPAMAELDFSQSQLANGLAKAVSDARFCSYSIEQTKLEEYYVGNGLDGPDALAHISSRMSLLKVASKPDASSCTMSKATARKMGILKE